MVRCQYYNSDEICELISIVSGVITKCNLTGCQAICVPYENESTDLESVRKNLLMKIGFRVSKIPATPDELRIGIAENKITVDKTTSITFQPPKLIYTQKVLPSKLQMGINLAKTGIGVGREWLTNHRVLCCAEQAKDRRVVCDACEHQEFINEHERCVSFKGGEQGCGCYLEQKRKLAGARCDLGKWDEIDAKYEVTHDG